MEKNKIGTNKTRCICIEDSDETLKDVSETATVSSVDDEGSSKSVLENQKICLCTYVGGVKTPNRVSWQDSATSRPECVCAIVHRTGPVFDDIPSTTVIPPARAASRTAPQEEPKKKSRSFVETLKYIVTCKCFREDSETQEPKPEPEPEPEPEAVSTTDSGIISLLGRTYSAELSANKVEWKKKPLVLVYDVPQDAPAKTRTKDAKTEDVKSKDAKTKDAKTKDAKTKDAKTKAVTPKVSFAKPLLKKKESVSCICTADTASKYDTKTSSSISPKVSKVKCKCTEPEETRSGHLIATKCVCGQLTASSASLATGYSTESRIRTKPDCCYPEKSEEFIRKIDYKPSQYSYTRYDEPLRTYGLEAPSVRSSYDPSARSSAISVADSSQYTLEGDLSENLQLEITGSSYTYQKSSSVIPSRSVSETAAGPSKPTTLYQRLIKRFWLQTTLYNEPYQQPSSLQRVESAPSSVYDTTSLYRPASKIKIDPNAKKPTTKSKEKVCRCSNSQLSAAPSKESQQKANEEKPKEEKKKPERLTTEQLKAEISKLCLCADKSPETVSKKSKEELQRAKENKCHCKTEEKVSTAPSDVAAGTSKESKNIPTIVITTPEETEARLAAEKSEDPSKREESKNIPTIVITTPEETEARLAAEKSEDPSKREESKNIPAIVVTTPEETEARLTAEKSEDPSKREESKNVPAIVVTAPEETEAKLAAGTSEDLSKRQESKNIPEIVVTPPEESKEKSTLQVPSAFAGPVDVKKSAENPDQMVSGSSTENPEAPLPPPLAADGSGWWDRSKHLIIGSTVLGATAIGAYKYFKE